MHLEKSTLLRYRESIEKVSDSVRFLIQSIFSLTLANKLLAEKMWMRVDAEPSGTRFDSLLLLEMKNGILPNPYR